MKTKIVESKDLSPKNLTAKHYVLGPERSALISFEGEFTIKFHGDVGDEDYDRALARKTESLKKAGVIVGSINNVDDGSGE
jgi:hypothetical protein